METGEIQPTTTYPIFEESIPEAFESGRYRVHYARSREELIAIQRLRFEVFNVEMGEGLEESYETGLDQDRFDPVCHHLMVTEIATGVVVGTYRIQTGDMAREFGGFYSDDEYRIADFPDEVLANAVEVGRASVAKDFRNQKVLFLLWRGLARYMECNGKRYLFGCCSLTSQDPGEGMRVLEYLRRQGYLHERYRVEPRPGWECAGEVEGDPDTVKLPQLFRIYMRFKARVCSPPALDRHFKTIDYLVLLDIEDLDAASRALFFR